MERIMVVGISAGAGKSTFARQLGGALGLKVVHLDTLYWKPGWVEAPTEEFREAQRQAVQGKNWIIEGNYTDSIDIRMERADTIIYLELPLYVCLYRVVKRRIMNAGKTRLDMTAGCNEKLDWDFLKFILSTYYPRKKKMQKRFADFKGRGENKNVIELNSKQKIRTFLAELENGKTDKNLKGISP
ncbi:topology modulation protein [Bacillus marinisedimentorum]|uniref:topology modulation protein n=1 Tax=Bacillus marinisedimentorum TaxID=1821260 RepID=UPI000871EF34|nr:topology modulation protein [Bacillus marinisedimentorum]